MAYYPGSTEAERLSNAYSRGFTDGEIHGIGVQTENAYHQAAEEMRERLEEYIPHFSGKCPELYCKRSASHLEDCEDEYCSEHGCETQDCTCGREEHLRAAVVEQKREQGNRAMSFEMDRAELAAAVARSDVDWIWSAYEYGKRGAYLAGQGEMRELLTDARKHVLAPPNGYNYCRWCNGQRGDKGWTHDQHCYWVYMTDEARKLVDRIDERLGQEVDDG